MLKSKSTFRLVVFFLIILAFLLNILPISEAKLKQTQDSIQIEDFPYISQSHSNTCGAAALAMLLQYYGVTVTEQDIVNEYPNVYQTGFYIPWLWEYPKKKGLNAEFGSGDIKKVKNFIANDTPVLVYQFSYRGGKPHFRIATGYDNKDNIFIVNDPVPQLGKNFRISYSEFEDLWKIPWFKSPQENKVNFYLILKK